MPTPHVDGHRHAWRVMGSRGHTLQVDLQRDWVNLALLRDVWRGGADAEVLVVSGPWVAGSVVFSFRLQASAFPVCVCY